MSTRGPQFRAVLIDPGNKLQERAVQIFATSMKDVELWTAFVLPAAVDPNAVVQVWQTVEQQAKLITKKQAEEIAEKLRGEKK